MFSWFKSKPKEDWRLVKTLIEDVVKSDAITSKKENGKIYYHLFESDRGNRRTEFACSLNFSNHATAKDAADVLESVAKRFDTYQEIIYRWEMGRVDPSIPRYDQVPEEETINVLKGKIT